MCQVAGWGRGFGTSVRVMALYKCQEGSQTRGGRGLGLKEAGEEKGRKGAGSIAESGLLRPAREAQCQSVRMGRPRTQDRKYPQENLRPF